MRLIGSIKEERAARAFSQLLTDRGIENQLEGSVVTDWGNAEYGDSIQRIWVTDEDKLDEALELFEKFMSDSQHELLFAEKTGTESSLETLSGVKKKLEQVQEHAATLQPPSLGPITLYIILLCGLFYFWSGLLPVQMEKLPKTIPSSILLSSPVKKALLYDYPAAYEVLDRFIQAASDGNWSMDQEIPPEGERLLEEFAATPYWHGAYTVLVKYFRNEDWHTALQAPLFEKIRQGEVWRVATPALLHNDLLHILFNMLWLLILGRQMEERMGAFRYLLFCLIVAIFSNTAQYLVAGANFLGFSGVLCGMLTYIWVRQKRAPWEGYELQGGTFAFLAVFVLAMLSLQFFSLISEIYWNQGIASGIANTAHVSGAIAGYLLGNTRYFAWQSATIT